MALKTFLHSDAVMLMYLTLNGDDNCTAIAPRPCNGRPMLRRGLEVVGRIINIKSGTFL